MVGATLVEPVIILEEGLPVGLMKPVEVGGEAEFGVPFLLDQLVFLDQKFPLAHIVAVEGLILRIFAYGFASR